MIPNTEQYQEAILSKDMETSQATIAATPELMNLLSSGVYTDKILAVVREVSCNALDAHIANGEPNKPITVHLPTWEEQWFSVKDEGIGLSHDDIMSLYLTYGESRKTHTNQLIGGKGIGSKSPFSYTDAFTVTSVFNNVKRMYSIFKNNGIPQCALLSESITEDANGIEVKVPTKQEDKSKFTQAAEKVFKAFDVKPIINKDIDMSINIENECEEYFTESTNWNSNFYAKVGSVIYSVKHDKCKEIKELLPKTKNFYLKLPIGSVDITASREDLSMTPQTIKVVGDVLDKIYEEELSYYINMAEGQATLFDFCYYLRNLNSDEVKAKAKYDGKTFSEWDRYFAEMDMEPVDCFEKNGFRKTQRQYTINTAAFSPTRKRGECIIFLKDLKNGGITEFKEKMKYHTNNTIPLFTCEKEMDDFIELFQWRDCKVFKASDLKIKTPRTSKVKKVDQVEIMDKKNWSGDIHRRVLNNFDLSSVKKDILVVPLYKNGWLNNECFNTDFQVFKSCIEKGIVKHIFFIRQTTLRKMGKGSKKYNPHLKIWDTEEVIGGLTQEDIDTYLISKARDMVGSNDFTRKLLLQKNMVKGRDKRLMQLATKDIPEGNEDILRFKIQYVDGTGSKLHNMNNSLGEFKTNKQPLIEELKDKYPFLDAFTSIYNSKINPATGTEKYYLHLINEVDKGRI